MPLKPLNSSNLEQLALKGLTCNDSSSPQHSWCDDGAGYVVRTFNSYIQEQSRECHTMHARTYV